MKNILVLLLSIFTPAMSHAFNVTYTNPNYSSSYWRTPDQDMETISIAFDQNGDYYTEPIVDDGMGFVEIYKNETSVLTGYSTTALRVTGLATSYNDILVISETDEGGTSGQITKYDLSTQSVLDQLELNSFRATGIAFNPANSSILFTAKRTSDSSYDGIYGVDPNNLSGGAIMVVHGFRGTGIAFDQTGNYYVSTDSKGTLGFQGNSVYRFDSSFSNPLLIVAFDSPPDELTFDATGTLYVVGDPRWENKMYQIDPVPIPGGVWLLGPAVIGLLSFRRKKR